MEVIRRLTENNKHDPSASTYEERPKTIKRTPDPGVSKVEETMMSHLMEQKRDIAITGGVKYLAWKNEGRIGKLGVEQFLRKQHI